MSKDPLVNPLRYTSMGDIEQSIFRSWFMYKDIPCHVDEILDEQHILISLYKEDFPARIQINVNSIYFDIRNPPLGYVNQAPFSTWYGSRLNQRQYKRGLHRGNCHFFPPTIELGGPRPALDCDEIKISDIVNMLNNSYPSFNDVTQSLKEGYIAFVQDEDHQTISRAFHRDMCLCVGFTGNKPETPAEMSLYFKNNLLGMFDVEANHVVLLPSYHISFYIGRLIEAKATIRGIRGA